MGSLTGLGHRSYMPSRVKALAGDRNRHLEKNHYPSYFQFVLKRWKGKGGSVLDMLFEEKHRLVFMGYIGG